MQFWKKNQVSSAEEERRWERWRTIFNILENRHVASVSELLEATGGKESLLDKDLDTLCKAGLIQRTMRNGIILEAYHPEKPIEERVAEHTEAKTRIARLVVEKYIQPGMTLFADASTTVKAISPFIAGMEIKLITNCLSLIAELRGLGFAGDIICTGGTYRALSNSLVGEFACQTISAHTADIALLGTNGISSNLEIMEAHPEEALVKRTMILNAKRSLLLALPEKFRDTSLLPVASLSRIEALISSNFPDEHFVAAARELGLRLECPA